MTKADEAVDLFHQGFNCAQAVLSVFASDFGLDRDIALRIAQGFGVGTGRRDETCGAVSGAVMALGLRYGCTRADNSEAREKTYAAVADFIRQFKAVHGSVARTDLLGYDLADPRQRAEASDAVAERRPLMVRDAVELVEKLV
ncbi:MAG: C-GCAxxG-C-C family protein [Halobacteriota archaeon]